MYEINVRSHMIDVRYVCFSGIAPMKLRLHFREGCNNQRLIICLNLKEFT